MQEARVDFLHISGLEGLDCLRGIWLPGFLLCPVLSSPHRHQNYPIPESWRPRRDLNPCYRRERAMS